MTNPFTEEDLALMTPAEREAVTAGDTDDDLQTLEEISEGVYEAQDEQPKAKPVAEVAEDEETPTAVYVAPSVEDYDSKLSAAEARKDEAFKKMMEGELSDSEYREIEKSVSAEIRRLDRDMAKAEISEEMNQQAAKNAWHEYVQAQVDGEKKVGIDLAGNQDLMNELDRTVKLIARQVQEDPSMVKHLAATKPGALITNVDKWILSESLSIVKARHKLDAAPAARKSREPDLTGVPPTLSKVPVAAEASTGGDEFAYLSSLKGAEYEKALAKLSADQLDRYMA